jgi:hypothetical protein
MNGGLGVYGVGTTHTAASNAAVSALLAKGWAIYLDGQSITQ